ncbi:hypothetical protein [Sphingomonas sp. So64.6b]|uniref:hypothetical protein n=1 Tax=Sphingomonas sp. So64.6b TaxID=2997354 RepID=UPI001FCEA2E6|nr:hypothetical protein [Sphingomonas sp. So64.6b]
MRVYLPAGAAEPVIVGYKREVRADVTAAHQWLRARRPGIWAPPLPPPEEEKNIAEEIRKAMERVDRIAGSGLRQAPHHHALE